MKLRVSVLIFFFSAVVGAYGSSKKPVILPQMPPSTPQGLEGGFWRTDNNYDPILRLKNVLLKQPLQVTPSIFFADGTQYQLPAITLEPAGIAQVDILYAIQSAPANIQSHVSSYGMAGISYQWSWPAVIATVQNTDEIASLTLTSSLHSDVRTVHAVPEVAVPQVVRGTWWLPTPDSDGFLMLENSSLKEKQVDVLLTGHSGDQLADQQVKLPSHGTTMLKLSNVIGAVRGSETAGGIELHYSGPDHGVLVYAGVVDENHGYSASPLLFEDHLDPARPSHNLTLDAPGLLLGRADPTMQFPADTYFTPYAILHNVSSHPIVASISLVTQISTGSPNSHVLQQVSLAAGETLQYDIRSQFTTANPLPDGYGNLAVSFAGHDGDLMVQAGSVDQSGSYVFEVGASQEASSASRTICFWSVEGDNDSMITIWNYLTEAQDLKLTLHFHGGKYVLPLHLGARASYNLDMMSLIRSQVPDANGNIIPSDAVSGSATLSGPKNGLQSISVSLSASVFNVRNATCGEICNTCNGVTGAAFQSSSYPVAKNSSVGTVVVVTMNTGETETNPPGQWETGNTSIATVNSNGNVTGVYPGVTNVQEVLVNMPVDAGTICSQQYVPCPTESFAESPAQLPVYPQITGISILTYGQSGSFVITGSGFSAWSPYSPMVTVHFSDYNISNGQVTGYIGSDSQISGTYYMGCGTRLDYQPGFWVVGQYADGGTLQTLSQPLPYALPGASAPTISFNGNPVNSVQSVVVGQQIALTGSQSLPNCMALQSQSWTQPTGTAIGGYTNAAGNGPPDNQPGGGVVQPLPSGNASNYTFYWVGAGNPLTANFQTVLITTSGDGFTEASPVGIAEFNVQAPSNIQVYTCGGNIPSQSGGDCPSNGPLGNVVIQPGSTPMLRFGGTASNIGIEFTASGTAPSGQSGAFSFAQILGGYNVAYTTSSGTCTANLGSGLDNFYPYPSVTSSSTNDNPGVPLFSDDSEVTASFSATMYVFWQSSIANSIPVPLGTVPWQFEGDAVQNAGSWSIKANSGSIGTTSGFASGDSYPTWGPVYTNGPAPCN